MPGLLSEVQTAPLSTTLAMVYLGVFPTAIAYAFSRMPAARAASFLYVIPVMAYVIAWLWLGEIPTLLSVVGGVVTLAGVLLVNVRGRRR